MARKSRISIESGSDDAGEFTAVYGDMITFVATLFILLFTITYNEKKDDTFFTKMRLTFGAEKVEQNKVVSTEELFVSKLQGYIEKEHLQEQARVLVDEQKIKLILNPPVLFDIGHAELKPEGVRLLDGIAQIFGTVKNPIIVEGHTDNVPIHNAQFESNWELSFSRSFSVVKLFMNKYGFSPKQLSCLGYGEYWPVVPNDSDVNRGKNRRIEINVIRVTEAASTAPQF